MITHNSAVNFLKNSKILNRSKLKAIAGYKINLTKIFKFVLRRVENIAEKGENAGFQHFLLFVFQKVSSPRSTKLRIVWLMVNEELS
jgi:hypothetical protein